MMKTLTIEWMKTVTCLAIVLAMLPSASYAVVNRTWTGAGSNNRWATTNNWDTSTTPWAAGDSVIFDGSASLKLSNTLYTTSQTIDVLTFTVDQTAAVTIDATSSGKLFLGKATASSATNLSVKAGTHKFVGANGGSGATADLEFNGPAGGKHYLDVSGSASFEIAGRLNEATPTDAYYKIGTGTLILSAHNGGGGSWVYPAAFEVRQGVLRFANNNASGNSANDYKVFSGAALEITNYNSSATSTWTLNGTGISNGGALRSIGGTCFLTSTGYVALASASSIGVDSGTLTINRLITGSTNVLTKVGAGTLVLATTNTYSGGTIVQEGMLSLGTNQALKVLSPVTLSGGTLAMNTYSNALGSLTLSGNAVIDLGDGTGSLSFTNSSAITWSGTLTLTGTLGEKTLRFGTDRTGLSIAQKAMINCSEGPVTLDGNGYVIKRPGTIFMIF